MSKSTSDLQRLLEDLRGLKSSYEENRPAGKFLARIQSELEAEIEESVYMDREYSDNRWR